MNKATIAGVVALAAAMVVIATFAAQARPVLGSLDVQWSKGAADCKTSSAPPMQVHRYELRSLPSTGRSRRIRIS